MYRTAKAQGKGKGKGNTNTFETDLSHHPLQLSPLKVVRQHTIWAVRCRPTADYGSRRRQTTKKDVANQDLMVRMIRMCVGLINRQKGTAQGHAGKIRFIKLVTSALERRGC